MKIQLTPVWRFARKEERELDARVLALLEAIEQSGKLTVAARNVGISHRHAWNLIERWEQFLGVSLVVIERGRGTQLSTLGAKLLWAGKRAQARLEPELENLAAELANLLRLPAADKVPVLRVHASHDFSLVRLREVAASQGLSIDLRYHGSAEALDALRRGACDVAGFHVTEGPIGRHGALRYREALGAAIHRLISVAARVQGLIVAPGNPKRITHLSDLLRPGMRFINRQRDSGTRILLDRLLQEAGIDPAAIAGYDNEEHTHAAVGAHVAGGLADAGLGIEAAATQYNLGFIPIATERYFFAVHKAVLERPEGELLLELVRGEAFRAVVAELHGERAHRTGEVSTPDETPPWNELT